MAKRFERSAERHEVSRARLERATRLVHAICLEARRRRWQVATPARTDADRRRMDWQPTRDRHLVITAAKVELRIRVREEGVHLRGRHEAEQRSAAHWPSWSLYRRRPVPEGDYDQDATGRLELQLDGGRAFGDRRRRSSWRDRGDRLLEEALPQLFAEIVTRVIEDGRADEQARLQEIERQEQARRAAAERERRWHELMGEARAQFVEDRRVQDLEDKLARWELTSRLTAFISACEEAHGDGPGAQAWLSWARALRDRTDPLASPPELLAVGEPTHEDLLPFMPPGWSPYRV